MGLENTRLVKPSGGGGGGGAGGALPIGDDDEGESGGIAHDEQLLRALKSIGQQQGKAGDEDDAEYAELDAMCKQPGGACALPDKKKGGAKGAKTAKPAAAAAADAAAAASTPATAAVAASAAPAQK